MRLWPARRGGALATALALTLAACTQFPELDAARSADVANAPWPDLVPIETLLAGPPPRATEAETASVSARAAELRARAARLQAPVVDAATKARMRRGVSRPVADPSQTG
ncbi:hypothetical protein [Litorisediminicola beolgyonensis]|uniref:DUF3035 domain-containing protein n=1 Tax=Litorisediminicola beolgyonensis TaxID=1173614 RepID=A0ABW3ZDZ5_9RHOB